MTCPICTRRHISDDVCVVDSKGTRVILQGRINAIIAPNEANYSPFADYYTVSLYPRKGRVKYLKFETKEELDRWGLSREDHIRCQGCLHNADGREIVFDVSVMR